MAASVKKRQAVLLIHGIGEQHPIVTLRDFVESMAKQLIRNQRAGRPEHPVPEGCMDEVKAPVPEEAPEEVVFWDKPDPVSGNYETRRMTMKQGRNHSTTDFYEFYWAHHMRDTNFSHISDWLQRVVFRRPGQVSPRLRPVFFFFWSLILVLLVIIGIYVFIRGYQDLGDQLKVIGSGVAVSFVLGYFSRLLFNYLGDAARYLDPSPGNIGERQAIRSEGIALLKRLHETGKYQRIIIVSHSLGTTIAYDLIKFLWNEYHKSYDPERLAAQFLQDSRKLRTVSRSEVVSRQLAEGQSTVADFQAAQRDSFDYLRCVGNKWLITDLLTIGSPLAHAGHLFAQRSDLFEKLKDQREYPTCPPYFQWPDHTNILKTGKMDLPGIGHRFELRYFNHSSPFSVVRWTNLYYRTDYIGGPLSGVFGNGICDIELPRKSRMRLYPSGHTRYWDFRNEGHVLDHIWKVLKHERREGGGQ